MSKGNKFTEEFLRRNEVEIRRLHRRIHETVPGRYLSDEGYRDWQKACADFHNRYDQLAFPGGWMVSLRRLRTGDTSLIDDALTFLEVRPYFFRSGYMYHQLRRVVGRLPMTEEQHMRFDTFKARWLRWRQERLSARSRRWRCEP